MEKVVRTIFEHTASGRLDAKLGAQLLAQLKEEQGRQSDKRHAGRDMAIVGMAARLPEANTIEQFWDNLQNGVDCITPFPEIRQRDIDPLVQYTYLKGRQIQYSEGGYLDEIDKFDYKFFHISPKEACLMDPAQRLFLQVAWHTLEDAGYGGDQLAGSRTGLYVGYSGWPMYGQFVSHAEPESFELSVMGNISAIITKRLPQLLNLRGPSMLIDTACSSSLTALHLAVQSIRNGECEQAVVGGIRILLMPVEGSISYGIESRRKRPLVFDDGADGTVLSEGVAAVMIKPLERAREEGDHIYAVIKGSAVNQDGTSVGIATPNVIAQEEVIVRAWEDAGIDPTTISYIEAMGTATRIGDPIEIDAINRAFRRYTEKKQFCAIGSLKTNIGHTDSTAGVAAVIKAALALQNRKIPPTIHFQRPNRNINLDKSSVYVNDRLAEWECETGVPRRCGISSFGFSGTNCHVILEETEGYVETSERSETESVEIFTLSAKNEHVLRMLIEGYQRWTDEFISRFTIADICFTANAGRGHFNCRLAFTVADKKDFTNKIHQLKDMKTLPAEGCEWLHYAEQTPAPKAVVDTAKVVSDYRIGAENTCEQLCSLYIQGVAIPWNELYRNRSLKRISSPLYPFERFPCWLNVRHDQASSIRDITFNF